MFAWNPININSKLILTIIFIKMAWKKNKNKTKIYKKL